MFEMDSRGLWLKNKEGKKVLRCQKCFRIIDHNKPWYLNRKLKPLPSIGSKKRVKNKKKGLLCQNHKK